MVTHLRIAAHHLRLAASATAEESLTTWALAMAAHIDRIALRGSSNADLLERLNEAKTSSEEDEALHELERRIRAARQGICTEEGT